MVLLKNHVLQVRMIHNNVDSNLYPNKHNCKNILYLSMLYLSNNPMQKHFELFRNNADSNLCPNKHNCLGNATIRMRCNRTSAPGSAMRPRLN